MDRHVRKFRIFIASPSDVAKEREAAREVVVSVSQHLGNRGGFVLEPVGWEDVPADAGRPQALINPRVRECDVFLGILWSRFGTETGVAESGTLEEFQEAESVRRQTGVRPTVKVFFCDRAVPIQRLRDADGNRQFEKVQEFRERYIAERRGIAKPYSHIHQFRDLLRQELEDWCAERFRSSSAPDADPTTCIAVAARYKAVADAIPLTLPAPLAITTAQASAGAAEPHVEASMSADIAQTAATDPTNGVFQPPVDREPLDQIAQAFERRLPELAGSLEFDEMFRVARKLEEWVLANQAFLSPDVRARLYLVLAQGAVEEAARNPERRSEQLSRGEFFAYKARPLSSPPAVADGFATIEACLKYYRESPEAALSHLAQRSDPASLGVRLKILLREQRAEDAANLARHCQPEQTWCDLSVVALVRAGDPPAARRTIEWAKDNTSRTTASRCALFFAQEQMARVLRLRGVPARLAPGTLTTAERQLVRDAIDVLQPLLVGIGGRIENELESQAVQAALEAYHWLAEKGECERLGKALATRKPVPLALAQAALAGRVEPSVDLPKRIRDEHPDSFDAKCLAALVEGKVLGHHREAFLAAKALIGETSSESNREQLAKILIDLAQDVGDEADQEVDRLAPTLTRDQRLLKLLSADRLLKKGAHAEAEPILAETVNETDPTWLQLAANRHLQAGEAPAAIDLLLKATALLPDPVLLTIIARIACEHDRPGAAAEALDRLLKVRPGDISAHRSLAELYAQIGDFARAANQYRELFCAVAQCREDRDPSREQADRINQAICLARSNQPEESLDVFRSLCTQHDPPLRALLGVAEVLTALGRAGEAFQTLRQVKDKYWGEPEFVQEFLQSAFRSGNEDAGHQAMVRLQQLQAEGRVAPQVLQAVPLDEIVEDLKDRRERLAQIHREMLAGRASWVLADLGFGSAAYWGWRIRTQEMSWVYDDPVNRAMFSIYATNGLACERVPRARLDWKTSSVRREERALLPISRLSSRCIGSGF